MPKIVYTIVIFLALFLAIYIDEVAVLYIIKVEARV